jgi:trk system potassium uptake protein TrkA
MYLIIVGAGDIGTPLIQIATAGGNEVVVVEQDETKAEHAATSFDCLPINDDATSKGTLVEAGGRRADALISTTDEDATNIMVCLLGLELDIPVIVSVVHNPEHMELFEQIGVNVIENPERLIAEYLYRAVKRPAIIDFMRVGETAEVFEIVVEEGSPIAGKTIVSASESGLVSEEMLIVAVDREGTDDPITPRGDTEIRAGDILTVYSAVGATPTVTDVFGHHEDHAQSFW